MNMSLNQPEEMPVDFPELKPVTGTTDALETIDSLAEQAKLEPDQRAKLKKTTVRI